MTFKLYTCYRYFSGKNNESEIIHYNDYSLYLMGLGEKVEWDSLYDNMDKVVKKIYSLNVKKIQIILLEMEKYKL